MADVTCSILGGLLKRFRDMGDGTHAEVVAFDNSATLSNSTVTAFALSKVIKATAGNLRRVKGYSNSLSPQFIQLHDAAAVPANGAIPVVFVRVESMGNFSIDYGTDGRQFSNGIVVCNSSTAATKTSGAADCWFDAQYE